MEPARYKNGQPKTELANAVKTHFFVDGSIKAQGPMTEDGKMDGRWIFNKKEGHLWQAGSFERDLQHGEWTVYAPDGSVESTKVFEHGRRVH